MTGCTELRAAQVAYGRAGEGRKGMRKVSAA
jgi:hypothetical protein